MNNIILNEGQQKIYDEAIKWYHYSSDTLFQIAAEAGCGKSVLVGEIVRKATIVSVNEEVEHFDLDLINGGGHGKPPKGDGEHKGGEGGGKHNSNEIDEICLNVTNSFL